jgi:hypothetical protein
MRPSDPAHARLGAARRSKTKFLVRTRHEIRAHFNAVDLVHLIIPRGQQDNPNVRFRALFAGDGRSVFIIQIDID